MKEKLKRYNSIIIWAITGILACLTGLLLFFFISYSNKLGQPMTDEKFDHYYALITDNTQSSFWNTVYKSAYEKGLEKGAYVEMISENLSRDYTREELMEIAIDSGCDGIMIEADESTEMSELINRAYSKNIPVVTMYSDNTNSERLCYVGINNYNLGREYGNLILKIAHEKSFPDDVIRAIVLMDTGSADSGQNVLYSAIKDTVDNEEHMREIQRLPIEISMVSVDSTNSFSVEESIRNLFIKNRDALPDIIVCLNEIDTTSVYQTVVDYNYVGRINILGYYDSEAIVKGIDRNVIYATVSTDTGMLGSYCIDALSEYFEFGNTSQYLPVDISVITKDNVSEYMEEDNDEN